jgi:hypothetical protein
MQGVVDETTPGAKMYRKNASTADVHCPERGPCCQRKNDASVTETDDIDNSNNDDAQAVSAADAPYRQSASLASKRRRAVF